VKAQNMTETRTDDSAAIEQEIRQTQNEMSSTIDRIGDQLSIKNLFNAALDKADENNVDARMLLDGARRNPVALGLIAVGAIWLISEKDARIPSFRRSANRSDGEGMLDKLKRRSGSHRHDYVSHMSAVEQRPDEDEEAYRRRRDIARSNFFMVERGHDEDEKGFRQRLDAVAESYRGTKRAVSDRTSALRDRSSALFGQSKQGASTAISHGKDAYASNPIIGGLIAAAVGAAIGAALPPTQAERGKLGKVGGKLREQVSSRAGQATDKLREKKDELLSKADNALRPPEGNQGGGGQETSAATFQSA
jgi:ElaB/YqjD/DUF883 family membrane-anchored ribosome-binding protein